MITMRNRMTGSAIVGAGVLALAFVAGCDSGTTGQTGPPVPTIEPSAASTTATVPTTSVDAVSTELPAPPPPSGPGAAPRAGVPDCRSADLRLSVGQGEGAAGTVYRPLRFTNAGNHTCVLHGFPGVSYVAGEDGRQVGPAATRVGEKGDPVTLAPGETASADVGFVNVRNFDEAACKPTPVRGLRVYPPQETASVFVPLETTGCAGVPPGPQLDTKAVRRGAG